MIPRARREALEWDDKLKRDRSRETRVAFDAWLAADAANRAEYGQIGALDGLLGKAGVRATMPEPRSSLRLWPSLATAAAVGAVIAVIVIGPPLSLWPGGSPMMSAAQAQLTTPLRLADGTLVILSKTARATPRFSSEERRVALSDGSARFIVAEDSRRPLIVETPQLHARADDGVFEVDAVSGGGVTVIAGEVTVERVPVAPGEEPSRVVAPGQRLDGAALTLAPAPQQPRVGTIEADGLTLGDLLRIANTAEGVPLGVADAHVGSRRVTGRFDVADHRKLARRLAVALDLMVDDRGDRSLLAPP